MVHTQRRYKLNVPKDIAISKTGRPVEFFPSIMPAKPAPIKKSAKKAAPKEEKPAEPAPVPEAAPAEAPPPEAAPVEAPAEAAVAETAPAAEAPAPEGTPRIWTMLFILNNTYPLKVCLTLTTSHLKEQFVAL